MSRQGWHEDRGVRGHASAQAGCSVKWVIPTKQAALTKKQTVRPVPRQCLGIGHVFFGRSRHGPRSTRDKLFQQPLDIVCATHTIWLAFNLSDQSVKAVSCFDLDALLFVRYRRPCDATRRPAARHRWSRRSRGDLQPFLQRRIRAQSSVSGWSPAKRIWA